MSQQRQFEGPDVRLLLDEICATYGPEPTIAKAESFRTGGVLGFFQKEHYRLVVEGDPAEQSDTEMKEKSLIYQAPSKQEGNPRGRHFAGAGQRPADDFYDGSATDFSPTAEITALASPYSSMSEQGGAGDGREDLFASLADDTADSFVSDQSWLSHPAGAGRSGAGASISRLDSLPSYTSAPVSTSHAYADIPEAPPEDREATFEAVLRRMAEFVEEPQAVPVTWPSAWVEQPQPPVPASAGVTTNGQSTATKTATGPAPLAQASATSFAATQPPAPVVPSTIPQAAIAVSPVESGAAARQETSEQPTAEVGADLFDGGKESSAPAAGEVSGETGEVLETESSSSPVLLPERIVGPAIELFQSDSEDGFTVPLLPVRRMSADEVSLRLDLNRVGFDLELIERIEALTARSSLEGALLEVFESLTPPPRMPRRAGSIIVVVGDGRHAAVEARRIADEVGSDPTSIAYATERRLPWPVGEGLLVRSVEDAQELAPGHRRGRIGIITVDASVGSVGTAWAASIITAVRPTLVVGVVDAMYKNEDISDWTDRLGGVDTLVLENVDCTVSPARLLSLEIPVNRIDESPATPTRWTAAVLDRLDPDHGRDDDDSDTVGMHFAGRTPTC